MKEGGVEALLDMPQNEFFQTYTTGPKAFGIEKIWSEHELQGALPKLLARGLYDIPVGELPTLIPRTPRPESLQLGQPFIFSVETTATQGIDRVEFSYRLNKGTHHILGTLTAPPYQVELSAAQFTDPGIYELVARSIDTNDSKRTAYIYIQCTTDGCTSYQ